MPPEDPHTVRDVMSTALATVAETDRLDIAGRIMYDRGVRQLLVVDPLGRLVGALSYRAILRVRAAVSPDADAPLPLTGEVMDRDVPTVSPGDSLLHVVRTFLSLGVSALPVVDGEALVGVVSEHDLVHLTAGLLERSRRGS